MKTASPLLSLCIPTYNRGGILRQALDHLVALPVFNESDDIEVVISDNASTDETQEVGESFVARYPDRIHYYRNERNVVDINFGLVIDRASGVFRKLANDTLLHTDEGIRHMLNAIHRYQDEKPILCFQCLPSKRPDRRFHTLDALWRERSYFTTWIAEFGLWADDFTSVADFTRAESTHLVQVDFLLRLMSRKKDAVVVEDVFFTGSGRKNVGAGGVNVARVFGRDYLDLLVPYVASGEIDKSTFNREKWRVFRYNILNTFIITTPGFLFPKTGFVKHLFKHYKWKWYFWGAVPFAWGARILSTIRNAIDI